MKTMKMITLSALLLLGFTLQDRAQSAQSSFDYTGNIANYGDDQGGWEPGGPVTVGGETLGAPTSAEQFTITTPTYIKTLYSTLTLATPNPALNPGQTASVTFTYDIYSESTLQDGLRTLTQPIPYGPAIAQSAPITVTSVVGAPIEPVKEKVNIDVELQPGTYWIAEENTGSSGIYDVSQKYKGYSNGNTAQTPEPTVWVFFAFMFGFIILKGRKNVLGRLV